MSVLKAIKENKVYTVNTSEEVKAYKAKGFDIYEDGKLKERGTGKSVPSDKYEALEKEISDANEKYQTIKKELENHELKIIDLKEKLDTKYGVMLLQPAYTKYHLELGEVTSYPPGYKENAGIFCHNNPWVSIAETVIGRGDRAFEIYKKTCPAYVEDISDIHRTEPYVYSQMVAGRDAKYHGEAKNSWLTGTAAWTFTNISQYILGVYPTHNGLSINPCVPSDFGDFKLTRHYRGVIYNI